MSQIQPQVSPASSVSVASFIEEAMSQHQVNKNTNKKKRRPGMWSQFVTKIRLLMARTRKAQPVMMVLTPAQQEQQNQAQAFLDSKMYESYATMLSYGYQANAQQKKHFDQYVEKLIDDNSDESKKLLETYTSLGYVFDDTLIYEYLLKCQYMSHIELVRKAIVKEKDDPNPSLYGYVRNYTHLLGEFNRVLMAKDFSHQFMKYLLKKMQSYSYGYELVNQQDSLIKLYEINVELFFNHISLKEMMAFLQFNQTIAETFSDSPTRRANEKWMARDMPKFIESYYKNDITRQLQKTKQTYHGALENFALKQAHESIEHPATRILPEAIKQKINAIEEVFWALKNSQAKVPDPQADFDMQNIFEKRIPEVLEKYLRVPEDYRNTMKHEQTGKTAYELMDESLDNYQQKLQALLANRVQTQLADMNATKIYSNQIK